MSYKVMIIDDDLANREKSYRKVFSPPEFELVTVESPLHLDDILENTAVDAYVVDAFLDELDWGGPVGDAGRLFSERFRKLPRPAPVFLISAAWSEPKKIIPILNSINQCEGIEVLRYLVWDEFSRASQTRKQNMDLSALRMKILDDLAIWHEQSTFRIGDDESIRILMLSDVQYGDPHTSESAGLAEQWIVQALNEDKLRPHLMILAGDIAYSGAPHEYQKARSTLDEYLLQPMWGDGHAAKMRDRIIVVPGNHDVNLRFSACNHYSWHRDNRKWTEKPTSKASASETKGTSCLTAEDYSLEPFLKFAHGFTGSRTWELHGKASHVDRRFEQSGLRFYLFNSVTEMNTQNPITAEFTSEATRRMSRSLGGTDKPSDFFNIAVSHHGIQIGNMTRQQMKDWEEVGRQFFNKQDIRLWAFGHYHKADFNPIAGGKLGLVQLPTLTIRPSESTLRGFTLVELIRKNKKVTRVDTYFYHLNTEGIVEKNKPDPFRFDV